MPLQNRVTPMGSLHVDPARGTFMGNRGILHDQDQQVCRTHGHQAWVTCLLSFKDRKRKLMTPGRYTELFFLDEATALAAGHRPCGECRRDAYRQFTALWQDVHGPAEPGRSLPQSIDRALHRARISRGKKVTSVCQAADLPDGAMIELDGQPHLIWGPALYKWSFAGYGPAQNRPEHECRALTPAPVLKVLAQGYRPTLHNSLPGQT